MNSNNYCIIMAGGTGSRFWPLCDSVSPKQFIDMFGTGKTMLQSTFERFERLCPRENIIIVTSGAYEEKVRQQIPSLLSHQVLCEPQRRNTAPCVAYAAAVIHDINPQANIIVSPSDHAVFNADRFNADLAEAIRITDQRDWIVTFGARPTDPNTKYGYIQMAEQPSLPDSPSLRRVVTFTEKPPVEMAMQFIMTGEFLWNAGLFIWRLPVLMEAYRKHLPAMANTFFQLGLGSRPEEVERAYAEVEATSVDVGIIEKASNVHVMEASFGWSDVETWETLYNVIPKDANRNAVASGRVLSYDCRDCIVHIPNNHTLVMEGLDNCIVTQSGTTLMICRRNQAERTAKFASDLQLLHR